LYVFFVYNATVTSADENLQTISCSLSRTQTGFTFIAFPVTCLVVTSMLICQTTRNYSFTLCIATSCRLQAHYWSLFHQRICPLFEHF